MTEYLGTIWTTDELIQIIKLYPSYGIHVMGCNYNSPSVDVYCNEEEESIELN